MKRFIDLHIPITSCNFNCHYCYVTQMNKNNTEKVKFCYSPEHVRKALSKERMGGVCLFNVCGLGETLIPEKVIDYIEILLQEGHYVMIVTNGTLTKRIEKICELNPDLLRRLFFKFSFHYIELKSKKKLDDFVNNVNRVREAGCSYTIEITPNDELEEFIPELKKFSLEHFGALPHVTIPRKENDKIIPLLSNRSFDDFCAVWEKFDSELFEFKKSIWGVKRREFCHAGEWSGLLNLGTGEWSPCYSIRGQKRNMFENIDKPFEFCPVGKHCGMPHCYNGHSFLTMGCIPEINTYHFAELRDRICKDGTHWLTPEVNNFFNTRLEDENNSEYTLVQKMKFEKIKKVTFAKNVVRKIIKK